MDVSATEALELAKTLNEMKPLAIWAFVLLVFFIVSLLTIIQIIKFRKDKRTEEFKRWRSENHNAVMEQMTTAIHKQGLAFSDLSASLSTGINALNVNAERSELAINRMTAVVTELKDRTEERISFSDTLRLIDTYFQRITARATEIIYQSLAENDYANRREYVSKRVRTQLGSFIDLMRADLNEYNLNFSYTIFLLTYMNPAEDGAGGERYTLCDLIWATIEPLYLGHNQPLLQRQQEAKLLITNTVRDHYSYIAKKVLERRSRGSAVDDDTQRYSRPGVVSRREYSRTPSDFPEV